MACLFLCIFFVFLFSFFLAFYSLCVFRRAPNQHQPVCCSHHGASDHQRAVRSPIWFVRDGQHPVHRRRRRKRQYLQQRLRRTYHCWESSSKSQLHYNRCILLSRYTLGGVIVSCKLVVIFPCLPAHSAVDGNWI